MSYAMLCYVVVCLSPILSAASAQLFKSTSYFMGTNNLIRSFLVFEVAMCLPGLVANEAAALK